MGKGLPCCVRQAQRLPRPSRRSDRLHVTEHGEEPGAQELSSCRLECLLVLLVLMTARQLNRKKAKMV